MRAEIRGVEIVEIRGGAKGVDACGGYPWGSKLFRM